MACFESAHSCSVMHSTDSVRSKHSNYPLHSFDHAPSIGGQWRRAPRDDSCLAMTSAQCVGSRMMSACAAALPDLGRGLENHGLIKPSWEFAGRSGMRDSMPMSAFAGPSGLRRRVQSHLQTLVAA